MPAAPLQTVLLRDLHVEILGRIQFGSDTYPVVGGGFQGLPWVPPPIAGEVYY
jgi:hypothetical protein